jgi:hypothetical protein
MELRAWLLFMACLVLGGASLQLWVLLPERRLRARLRENGYRLCTQCGYALNSEHDGHPCPECGAPVDLAEFERAWRKFLWKGLEPPLPPRRR